MSNLLAHSCLNLLTQHTFVLAAILNTFLSLNTVSSPPDWQWVSTLNKVHCDSGQQGGELWADQTVRKLQKMKSIWDHIERETQVICYTSDCREITFFFFCREVQVICIQVYWERTKWPAALYRKRSIFPKWFLPATLHSNLKVRGSGAGWSGLWSAKHWKVKQLLRETETMGSYVWKCWLNLLGITYLSNKLLALESLSHYLFWGEPNLK